jgi:uncharacterized protein YhfF/GNAT superfamily N-acetyltransferase
MAAAALDPPAHDPRAAAFWREYCRAAGLPPATPYQAWHFGDSAPLAHELVELVLHGPKRATAALAAAVERCPNAAPIADGYSVVTEFDGRPRAVLRTVAVEQRALRDVDARFAWDEGEGDRTLADWMDGHRRYFARECAALGIALADDAPVLLERFELLYPFDAAMNPVDCGPRIVPGWLPGAAEAGIALLVAFHAREFGFGAGFEAELAGGWQSFLARFDPARDGLWLLVDAGRIHGSIAIDGQHDEGAELHWFIVDDALRGRGLGRRMLETAMGFCRRRGHRRVRLTTLAGLDTARALYERLGFRLVAEADGRSWGRTVREQRFEWKS